MMLNGLVPTSTIPPYFLWARCPSCHPTNIANNTKIQIVIFWNHIDKINSVVKQVLISCIAFSVDFK